MIAQDDDPGRAQDVCARKLTDKHVAENRPGHGPKKERKKKS